MADIFDQINDPPVDDAGQGDAASFEAPVNDGQGGDGSTGAPEPASGQGTAGDAADTSQGWNSEFKTPEELYEAYRNTKKSYDNLRPKLTETTMKLSEIMKQQQPQPQQPQQGASYEDRLVATVQNILVPLQQQQAQLMMQNEVNRLATEHDDFNEVAPDMMKVLEDNPELWNTKSPLELAYQIAQTSHMKTVVQKVAKDARADAYKDREIKEVNNFQSGKGSQMTAGDKTPEQEIRESIVGASSRKPNYFI